MRTNVKATRGHSTATSKAPLVEKSVLVMWLAKEESAITRLKNFLTLNVPKLSLFKTIMEANICYIYSINIFTSAKKTISELAILTERNGNV